MKGPSTRRFLDGLVHRPFTLGHRVGAVNPRQFRGFNRPALAAGMMVLTAKPPTKFSHPVPFTLQSFSRSI